MINNKERIGAFTSSNIYKLVETGKSKGSFSVPGLTYIQDKKIERRLGRSVDTDNPSKDMLWGLFLEQRVYDLIGGEAFSGYKKVSNVSISHPKYPFWGGSPDLCCSTKVGDIKCFKPKNFALLTDSILSGDIDSLKSSHPKEYWQLVSNAAITGVKRAEMISYMPHENELQEIKEMCDYLEGDDQWRYKFISDKILMGDIASLSYLPNEGYYKSLNRFEFEVPLEDIENLTSLVIEANELISEPSVIIAEYDNESKVTIIENKTPKNNLII